MKHTKEELKQWQALPLGVKVLMTEERIRNWVREFGEEGVYLAFSGGKDSTVLLDIIRNKMGYTNIPAVFADTGLEYPEIREFVKTFENVVWVKPEMNFKKVIEQFGYPIISKEVSKRIYEYNNAIAKGKDPKDTKAWKELNNESYFRGADGNLVRSLHNKGKWLFLTKAPFKISARCCEIMKENPSRRYAKQTGRKVITAQMASESLAREGAWLKNGCNAFNAKHPASNPMAFWTDQDVLHYIKENNLPICSVYGEIIEENQIEGQMSIADYGLTDDDRILRTTGCRRTGCMFCGYGCHLEKSGRGRFETMKETHPSLYEWIMKPWDKGGLGYKDVIDWLNEHGGLNIRY